jgi:8-oxo-dGTP pyrophosphatase MutT (NUDIX family)
MPSLRTIFRDPNANPHGTIVERQAVRAIVFQGQQLLLVYSPVNMDYKFPGGGVKEGEKPEQALERELLEECGARLTRVIQEIGHIVEYAYAKEPEFETFKMTSHYFLCKADAFVSSQALEAYEADLGFQPVWVEPGEALQVNKSRLEQPNPARWMARETFMLSYLQNNNVLK